MSGKLSAEDKKTIQDACDSSLQWIESNNATASKAEFEEQKKKLEGTCMPIMSKLAGEAGGMGGMPDFGGAAPSGSGAGPSVEEFDLD